MKTRKAGLMFVSGIVLGLSLALGLGAVQKAKEVPSKVTQAGETPKTDWSRLKVFGYPNGATGIFDPDTGTIYLYDANIDRCYMVRELTTLGERMRQP